MTNLDGRRAVVTGAASGIGRAVAKALAGAGAHVVVADRDEDAAYEAAEDLNGTPWVIDLDDTRALGTVDVDADILVNNAGLQVVSRLSTIGPGGSSGSCSRRPSSSSGGAAHV